MSADTRGDRPVNLTDEPQIALQALRDLGHDGRCDDDHGRCGRPATWALAERATPAAWNAGEAAVGAYCTGHVHLAPRADLAEVMRTAGIVRGALSLPVGEPDPVWEPLILASGGPVRLRA